MLGMAGLRRVRALSPEELGDRLDDLEEEGLISSDERNWLVAADLVARALREGREVWVVAEVASTVEVGDVERAAEGAAVLARALGVEAVSAVAGRRVTAGAEALARERGVLVFILTDETDWGSEGVG